MKIETSCDSEAIYTMVTMSQQEALATIQSLVQQMAGKSMNAHRLTSRSNTGWFTIAVQPEDEPPFTPELGK